MPSIDPKLKAELKVMAKLPLLFDTLPSASRKRVLVWLTAVYLESTEPAEPVVELGREDIILSKYPPPIPAPPKVPLLQKTGAGVATEPASYRSKRIQGSKVESR